LHTATKKTLNARVTLGYKSAFTQHREKDTWIIKVNLLALVENLKPVSSVKHRDELDF
jgi:hypothetical protein